VPLILGTSTKLDYAKESWRRRPAGAAHPGADDLHEPGRKWCRKTNGETESWTLDDCRYKIAASNEEGGRSLTINRGIADELRQHHDYEAWDAFEPACSPMDAQIWALSNAGDDKSVVLNDLRQDGARLHRDRRGDGVSACWSGRRRRMPTRRTSTRCCRRTRASATAWTWTCCSPGAAAKRLGGRGAGRLQDRADVHPGAAPEPGDRPAAVEACLDPGHLADARSRWRCASTCPRTAARDARGGRRPRGRPGARRDRRGVDRPARGRRARAGPARVGGEDRAAGGRLVPAGPAAAVAARLADRRKDGVTAGRRAA
jgi:hypothetical protein